MKKITPLILLLLIPAFSFGQIYFGSPIAASNGGSVTATAKNWEVIEINPANLGWSDNHTFSLSLANIGINFADNGLNLASSSVITELKHIDTVSAITPTERAQMYDAVTAPGGLNISSTINWIAFSFTLPKVGGFAFSLTDKIYAHVQLSQNAARILDDLSGVKDTTELKALALQDEALLALNSAQIADGTNAGGYHYRELNMNYGRKILTIPSYSAGSGGASFEHSEFLDTSSTTNLRYTPIQIYAGFGFKPIWGLGSYNATVTDGENVEEGSYVYTSDYMKNLFSDMFHANGRGYGIDLGLSATYKKWTVGFSATDLGKITWHNNSFEPLAVRFPPIDSIPSILNNNAKLFNYFVNHNASNTGGAPDYTTQLPSQFRTGISYKVGKLLTLSSDFVAPLNKVQGNLLNPYYGIGAHVDLFRIIGFGVGYATEKDFGNLVPMGLFINVFYGFEVYVGTNDVLAYFNPNGHVLSGSVGIKLLGF